MPDSVLRFDEWFCANRGAASVKRGECSGMMRSEDVPGQRDDAINHHPKQPARSG